MQDENFDDIEELKNAESNQALSKLETVNVSEKDFPEYSEFPVENTTGLSYKAPKPTVERREPTIAERLAQGPKYKDRSNITHDRCVIDSYWCFSWEV